MSKLLIVLLFLLPTAAFADGTLPGQKITRIATGWGGEGIYITLDGGHLIEGCTQSRVIVERSNPMLDHILSIALSAMHTKNTVGFRISGCRGPTHIALAIIVDSD